MTSRISRPVNGHRRMRSSGRPQTGGRLRTGIVRLMKLLQGAGKTRAPGQTARFAHGVPVRGSRADQREHGTVVGQNAVTP